MKIKHITDESIILTLPTKQRYLGLILTIFGILVPIYLYIINNYQMFFTNSSNLKSLGLNLSLGSLLGYIFILELPSIYYFFSIQNTITGFGHILLVFLNVTAFIGLYSSIFSFSLILISGIYLLTHFKSVNIDKTNEISDFQERIFLLFYSRKTIPLSEIKEIVLEYKHGLGFLNRREDQHRYRIKFFLFERDPGFENILISVEDEEESPDFFRPQTLRTTLISKPTLIDSSFFNFKGHEMVKFNRLIKGILEFTDFSLAEEIKKDKKTIIKYRK